MEGLINAHGGPQNFEQFLDNLFSAPEKTTGREQADLTGMIGQYAHGNEPSHHIAYLYNFVGKPEKTAQKVKFILDNFYKNSPDGLIGNEDCGQMSAWFVLSSIGIYPVTPGKAEWETVTPYFDEVKINLEDGTSRIINSQKTAKELKNLGFENIAPMRSWKSEESVQSPVISGNRSFELNQEINIDALNPDDKIYYALNNLENGDAKKKFRRYKGPVKILESTEVAAYAERKNRKSGITTAVFTRKPNFWTVDVKSKAHPQYTAGGSTALIDGIHGTENWRKGDWVGFQGQDFEAVVDLKKITQVKEVTLSFLQDSRAWILLPSKIEYYLSSDNKDYFLVATQHTVHDPKDEKVIIKTFKTEILPTDAKFLKIKALNFGKLPSWHQGKGNDAYIFIDEIQMN